MKFLLHMAEKVKPLFDPGGKLHRLYPLFEAADTFHFTPPDVTDGAPHVRDGADLKRIMMTVIIALLPCFLFGIYNAGYQHNVVNQVAGATALAHFLRGLIIVMPIVITSYVVGGLWEVLFALVRKHPINEGFLVTGLLFPLTLPPTIPLWQVAVGISFGVVIGKEIFGGTGFNVLNPALTSRAFLYFAYPAQISGDSVWFNVVDKTHTVEGFTGATALAIGSIPHDTGTVMDALHHAGFTLKSMFIGLEGGSIGETSALACLMGAVVLILTGVGSWRIMAGTMIGLAAGCALFRFVPSSNLKPIADLPFYYHAVMGGFAFGAVFMATDPVSAAASTSGKWIYGCLIGFLVIVIRLANPAYPESVMLAILFMNVMAPMIDHFVLQAHIKRRARYVHAQG
ncbi:MAG: NADH:ubiquinone reductase (Na(+)-transporting) subunit B [bacterium]